MLSTAASLAYVVLICVVLPLLAFTSKRAIDRGLIPGKLALYGEALLLQLVVLSISYGVAWVARVPLFRGFDVSAADALLGVAVLGLALTSMALGWRFAGPRARRRVAVLVPSSRGEKAFWVALAGAASVGEEIAFRGLLPALLHRLTGNLWVAIGISATAFALAHLLQGWASTVFVGLFGLVFHGIVLVTGGLWVAIAIHFAYDVIAGFTLGRVIAPRREGPIAHV